jgi:hypothetical protein
MNTYIEYKKGKKQDIKTGITVNEYAGQTNFIAVTQSQSKTFKTEDGADKWLAKQGYDRVGIKYKTHLEIKKQVNKIIGA